MKRKIKSLFSDPAAMLAGAILIAVVVFVGSVGVWIKINIGEG